MRGRKPTPSHLKLIAGNPGHRPLNANEPKPDPQLPPVPAHLSEEAKIEWQRLARELYQLGLLTNLDRAALAGYCQAYADWIEAEGQLRRFGKVIKSPQRKVTRRAKDGSEVVESSGGFPMQSPFLAMRNKALELMHKFGVEFGMSPSSRTRVNVSEGSAKTDPAHKYIG
jgi:P27 family predicted phage terminase small subunit